MKFKICENILEISAQLALLQKFIQNKFGLEYQEFLQRNVIKDKEISSVGRNAINSLISPTKLSTGYLAPKNKKKTKPRSKKNAITVSKNIPRIIDFAVPVSNESEADMPISYDIVKTEEVPHPVYAYSTADFEETDKFNVERLSNSNEPVLEDEMQIKTDNPAVPWVILKSKDPLAASELAEIQDILTNTWTPVVGPISVSVGLLNNDTEQTKEQSKGIPSIGSIQTTRKTNRKQMVRKVKHTPVEGTTDKYVCKYCRLSDGNFRTIKGLSNLCHHLSRKHNYKRGKAPILNKKEINSIGVPGNKK